MQRTPNLGLPLNLGGHVATALAIQEGFQKISEYLGVPLDIETTGHVPPQIAVQRNFAIIEREMGIELPKDVAGHVALMQTVREAFLLIDEEAREPEVEGITIDGGDFSFDIGDTVQLGVTASLDDGTQRPVTSGVEWTSSSTNVSLTSTGMATAEAAGDAIITASFEGFSDSITATVNEAVVTGITVSPASVTLDVDGTQQLSVQAQYSDSTPGSIPAGDVDWSSDNPGVATVNTAGLVTAVAGGSAGITGSYEGLTGTSAITVNEPEPEPEPEPEGGLAMQSGSGAIPISTATEGGETVYNVVLTDAETAPDYYYLSAQGLVEMAQNGEMSPQDAWGFLAGGSFERYLMVAQSLVALPVGTVFEMPGVENVSGFTCPDPETPTDDLPRVMVTGLPDASIRYLRLCDNTAGAIGWDGGVAPDNPVLTPKPISPEGPLGIQFNFDGDYAWDRTAATFQRYAKTPTVDDIIDQFGRAFREAFGNDPADPWHKAE